MGVANAADGPRYDSYGNLKVAIEEWNEYSDLDVRVTGGNISANVSGTVSVSEVRGSVHVYE